MIPWPVESLSCVYSLPVHILIFEPKTRVDRQMFLISAEVHLCAILLLIAAATSKVTLPVL